MPSQGQSIAPLEGTIAVAEVKSNLDRERLYQALENIASIPRLSQPESAIAPYIKRPAKEFWWDWPYKIIFACDAVSKESLWRNVVEFYGNHPHIPQESRASMIYVLGQYIVVRMNPGLQVMNPDGSVPEGQPASGEYRWFDNSPDLTALVFTFTEIQRRALLANHMIWKYDEWINPLIDRILNTQA